MGWSNQPATAPQVNHKMLWLDPSAAPSPQPCIKVKKMSPSFCATFKYLFCDLILFWKSLISKLLALPRILTGCWVLNILEVGGLTQPGLSITSSPPNMVFQGVRSMGSSGMYPRSPGFFWLVSCYAALVSHWSRGESAGCHCLPGSCCTHATLHLSYYEYSPYSSHDWWFSGFCCKDLKS